MPFTHLHVHTEYSLLDGSGKIGEMVARAKELGMDSLAITDHGAMYGVIEFYRAAHATGIKPIIGCEIYVTTGSRFDREIEKGEDRYYHLVLLAENNTGYKNLMKIVSHGFTEGFYYKPRVDYEILEMYHEGVIALSACLAGLIPKLLSRGKYKEARNEALRLVEIFGEGNFFLELQDHGLSEQKMVDSQLLRMSEEEGIPLVCTNDVHYVLSDDAESHDILLCIQTGKHLSDENRMRYEGGQYYMKSPEQMQTLFSYVPEAIENTGKIAERCNVEIEFGVQHLPEYDVPDGVSAEEYLTGLCEAGLRERYTEITESLRERLSYELSIIKQMGYVDYFLIVWDFINYARENGIPVGPGRGSAAGSLVSYCLKITDIDPIKYNLIFERFLNPERVSMPDIDVDFCFERRGEVIEYVTEKYGRDKVAQIITFGTMAARNVIRDVGRVMDMPYGAVDSIAKMIPNELGITIDKALKANNELLRAYETDNQIRYLIDMAKRLEGLPRHASMHAAGVVICSEPIMDMVPLALGSDGSFITQFTMTTLEELGLLKMDFLGLRTLTVIRDAVNLVKYQGKGDVNLSDIDYNDNAVLEMIGAGKCVGVFQLESAGMKSFMRELRPRGIEDIIAGIALYRPGPMDFIPKYIAGKNSAQSIAYDCPQLEHILRPTYGCIVYQEQVMQIARDLAGYSLGGADVLRRAMSKKKEAVMIAERRRFVYGDDDYDERSGAGVPGCVRNGISEKTANKIYDEMMDFAKYAFNKSHAAAYAIVSYRTAYLKRYYPAEYMAALMTSVMDKTGKLREYIQECKSTGLAILPPDVNKSESTFSVEQGSIRYGLTAIKGVGRAVIDAIVLEREEGGAYRDLYDFALRLIGKDINKRLVENLIKAGAFDCFGLTRKQLIHIYMDVLDDAQRNKKSAMSGQITFFEVAGGAQRDMFRVKVPDVGEFDKETLLEFEKDVTGIYISSHPLEEFGNLLKNNVTCLSADFAIDETGKVGVRDRQDAVIGGIIDELSQKSARSGQPMAFITLEDMVGSVEVIVFPKDYAIYRSVIREGAKVLIAGRASVGAEENGKLIASKIVPFENVPAELWIRFSDYGDYSKNEAYIMSLSRISPEGFESGALKSRIIIYLKDTRKRKIMPAACDIYITQTLLSELKTRFGTENVATGYRRVFDDYFKKQS